MPGVSHKRARVSSDEVDGAGSHPIRALGAAPSCSPKINERRTGELLKETDRAKGAREKGTRRGTATVSRQTKKLSDLGLSPNQSSDEANGATMDGRSPAGLDGPDERHAM